MRFLISIGLCALLLVQAGEAFAEEKKRHVIYERPSVKTLSQLYWRMLKLDPENDLHVDNFMMINECDLYRDYYQNEFEWISIRDAARQFLLENRKDFPIHFEFVQPLRFAEYDLETHEFDIWKPYKIKGVRRFEVLAEDLYKDVCDKKSKQTITGYPKGLLTELNRPFTLDTISVEPETARDYIESKLERNKNSNAAVGSKDDLYESRSAYLVMRFRVFSYKEDERVRNFGDMAKVLAVLESYQIYGDRDHQMLLFAEDFTRKKERSAMEVELKRKYQERLKQKMLEKQHGTEGGEVPAEEPATKAE